MKETRKTFFLLFTHECILFSTYLVGPGECHKLCNLTASQCARHVIETTTIKEEDVTFYSSYFVVTTLPVVTEGKRRPGRQKATWRMVEDERRPAGWQVSVTVRALAAN